MKVYIYLLSCCLCCVMGCSPKSTITKTTKTATKTTNTNTTAISSYMTNREAAMIEEVNLVRTDPQGYITYVEVYIKEQEALKKQLTSGQEYVADEIKTAKELIRELKKTPKTTALKPHKIVYKVAKMHGKEMNKTGKLDHKSTNGDQPWTRILREAPDLKDGSENLVGGPESVRESVMVLLVDSGIPGRGHRKNILNPTWKYIACYEVGNIGEMPYCWVQNFAK